jgi:hypothetical protein
MPQPRRIELDDLLNRPGTYFNPQTEVLLVVDDSVDVDTEIFNMEEFEGADWVIVSDEVPVDEPPPRPRRRRGGRGAGRHLRRARARRPGGRAGVAAMHDAPNQGAAPRFGADRGLWVRLVTNHLGGA